jgi:hypothetical protein
MFALLKHAPTPAFYKDRLGEGEKIIHNFAVFGVFVPQIAPRLCRYVAAIPKLTVGASKSHQKPPRNRA